MCHFFWFPRIHYEFGDLELQVTNLVVWYWEYCGKTAYKKKCGTTLNELCHILYV